MAKANPAKTSIATYRAKRDFAKTSEPVGKKAVPISSKLRFVIRRHAQHDVGVLVHASYHTLNPVRARWHTVGIRQ